MKTQTTNKPTECFAIAGQNNIIDLINPATGLSWHFAETLEQVQKRYPGAAKFNIDAFWSEVIERNNQPVVWTITSDEHYTDMLEVLPPAFWQRGVFLVGEPSDHHSKDGQPRFQAYAKRGISYYESSRPMTRTEAKAFAEGAPLVRATVQPDPVAAKLVSECAANPVSEAEENA